MPDQPNAPAQTGGGPADLTPSPDGDYAASFNARRDGWNLAMGISLVRANADVAVFGLRDGSFELKDSDGNVVTTKRRLLCQTTIKDGRIWYERPAGE